jgi:hypothetical protein
MPQKERPEERRARDAVLGQLSLEFTFTDLTGGVDYETDDGQAVQEVTRYTNPQLRGDMDVAAKQEHVLPLGTNFDWWVTSTATPRTTA